MEVSSKKEPLEITSEYIENASKTRYGKDYSLLSASDKITLATSLTEYVYFTRFRSMLSNLEDTRLNVFFTSKEKFGGGYREVFIDLLKVEAFSDKTAEDFYPYNPKQPKDEQILFVDRLQAKIRIDINQPLFFKYFKNSSDLSEYINMQLDSADKTLAVFFQQFIYNIFQTSDTPVWTIMEVVKEDDKEKMAELESTKLVKSRFFADMIAPANATIKKIRDAFKNKVIVEYEADADTKEAQLLAFADNIKLDVELAVEKANLTNSMGTVTAPFHIKPATEELVLLVHPEVLIKLDNYIIGWAMSSNKLELPKITTIKMSALSKDSYVLIDKRAIQLCMNWQEMFSWPVNPNTLWTIGALHSWFYTGVNPYAFGRRVTLKYKKPASLTTKKGGKN